LKQSYPYIETLKEVNISCDGNKVSVTVSKVRNALAIDLNLKMFYLSKITSQIVNYLSGI
jgi:hypothetical protein